MAIFCQGNVALHIVINCFLFCGTFHGARRPEEEFESCEQCCKKEAPEECSSCDLHFTNYWGAGYQSCAFANALKEETTDCDSFCRPDHKGKCQPTVGHGNRIQEVDEITKANLFLKRPDIFCAKHCEESLQGKMGHTCVAKAAVNLGDIVLMSELEKLSHNGAYEAVSYESAVAHSTVRERSVDAIFQGVTDDGKYIVEAMHLMTGVDALKEGLQQVSQRPIPVVRFDFALFGQHQRYIRRILVAYSEIKALPLLTSNNPEQSTLLVQIKSADGTEINGQGEKLVVAVQSVELSYEQIPTMHQRQAPDPRTGQLVTRVFKTYSQGQSYLNLKLADVFLDERLPKGNKFSVTVLCRRGDVVGMTMADQKVFAKITTIQHNGLVNLWFAKKHIVKTIRNRQLGGVPYAVVDSATIQASATDEIDEELPAQSSDGECVLLWTSQMDTQTYQSDETQELSKLLSALDILRKHGVECVVVDATFGSGSTEDSPNKQLRETLAKVSKLPNREPQFFSKREGHMAFKQAYRDDEATVKLGQRAVDGEYVEADFDFVFGFSSLLKAEASNEVCKRLPCAK